MTELGFLERKKKFSFSSHYAAAAEYLDSPLFIYSVYPWRLKFSFSFLGGGKHWTCFLHWGICWQISTIILLFFLRIISYWKAFLHSISACVFFFLELKLVFLKKNLITLTFDTLKVALIDIKMLTTNFKKKNQHSR